MKTENEPDAVEPGEVFGGDGHPLVRHELDERAGPGEDGLAGGLEAVLAAGTHKGNRRESIRLGYHK